MNTSKQSFKNIQVGDRIRFRMRDGSFRIATVNPLLIFDTHVVVNHGNCGTVVDEANYIGHRTPKARTVNLPQKADTRTASQRALEESLGTMNGRFPHSPVEDPTEVETMVRRAVQPDDSAEFASDLADHLNEEWDRLNPRRSTMGEELDEDRGVGSF